MEGENVDGPGISLPLGERIRIHNRNPATCSFRLTTRGGTSVTFPVPAFTSFEITRGEDLIEAEFDILELHPKGPRAS